MPTPDEPLPASLSDRLGRMRLQTPPEAELLQALSQVATFGASLFRVPMCLVSTLDESVQHILGHCGLDIHQLPSADTPCGITLAQNAPLLVNDCATDPRLAANPYVLGDFGLRFYAGVPLRDPSGQAFGTVCLLDQQARHDIDAAALDQLGQLAAWISDDLAKRRQLMAERDLFEGGPMAVVMWSAKNGWPVLWHSKNLTDVVGAEAAAQLEAGASFESLIDPRDRMDFRMALRSHSLTQLQTVEVSYRLRLSGGPAERWVRQITCMDNSWHADGPSIRGYLSDETRQKRLESGVARVKERLHLAMESAQLGTFDLDLDRGERLIDHRGAEIIGFRVDEMAADLDFWLQRIHPCDRMQLDPAHAKTQGGQDGFRMHEYRIRHRQGHYVWVQSYKKVVERRPDGTERRIVGTLLDITERKREEAMRNRQRQLLDVLNRAQASFLLTHNMHDACEGLFEPLLRLTDSQFGFIGVTREDANGATYLMLPTVSNLSWNDATERLYESRMASSGTGLEFHDLNNLFGHVVTHDTVVLTNDPASHTASQGLPAGHPPLESFLGIPIRFNGRVTGMIGLGNSADGYDHDIVEILEPLVTTLGALIHARELETARERAEAELQRMAATDALTGLPNRRSLMEAVRGAVLRSQRSQRPLAMAVMDLDHFKCVNDTYGHAAGDAVLRHLAQVAQSEVRDIDTVARLGGEEFALLMPDTPLEFACEVVDRLRERLAHSPTEHEGVAITVTLSAGVSDWQAGDTPDTLIARADSALYQAKAAGRNCVAMQSAPAATTGLACTGPAIAVITAAMGA